MAIGCPREIIVDFGWEKYYDNEVQGIYMAVCPVTKKSKMFGASVSHSHRVTKRAFLLNRINKRIFVPSINRTVRFKNITTAALRLLDKIGADAFYKRYINMKGK